MKKVLVTGAAGSIGKYVISYLLSEGKYEITALDLKSKKNEKVFKKYKNRINIIYGDIIDNILMPSLIKSHDIVISLAGVMPPLSEMSEELITKNDYEGHLNIINCIKKNNPNCHLIFPSTTCLYGNVTSCDINSKISFKNLNNYSKVKYNLENKIIKSLDNYTIIRMPLVLNNITKEPFAFNINKMSIVEVTTSKEVGYSLVKLIDELKKVNKNIYNIGGTKILYKNLLYDIIKNNGLCFRLILSRIFLNKNFYSPIVNDNEVLEKIIDYHNDNLDNYFGRLKRKNQNRKLRILISKFILLFLRRDKI